MHRIHQTILILRRRGPGYLLYLLFGYLYPLIGYHLLQVVSPSRLRRFALLLLSATIGLMGVLAWQAWELWLGIASMTGLLLAGYIALWMMNKLRLNRKQALVHQSLSKLQDLPTRVFIYWQTYPVLPETRCAIEKACAENPQKELVIGQIDNDGRVFCPYGPLPYVHNLSLEKFVPRYRFPLDIVLRDNLVLVRKDFQGDKQRFLNECLNLLHLDGHVNTPHIYSADISNCVIYKELILGWTVRDVLVDAGANILTVSVETDPDMRVLSEEERIYTVWKRGQALLGSALPASFLPELESQMELVHAMGIAKLSLTFGNIMLDASTGRPWLIDMEGSQHFDSCPGLLFDYERNRDREKFNQIYGCNLLTEKSARHLIQTRMDNEYAPIDFGRGLTTYGFWNTDSGTGRWDYLNGRVVAPLVQGKRVLDLGANNGIMDLMMLKNGACEVVALEYSQKYATVAGLVHQVFEWRDMRHYTFTVYQRDMRAILTESFGEFDVVTAYCSLYYLEPDDMAAVVRKAANLAPLMILQAKTHARPEAGEKGQKSTPEYLETILRNNGFQIVEVIAPSGFNRPILIGRQST